MKDNRILFGLVVSGDERDAPDEVLDALDDAGVDEDCWEWLVWRRRSSTYFVLRAPLHVRGALVEGLEDVRIVPLNMVAADMGDNRNVWLYPSNNTNGSALQRAERDLLTWMDALWRHETGIPEVEVADAEPTPEVIGVRARATRNRQAGAATSASSAVLAAFGLLGAKDSEGKEFNLVTLKDEDEGTGGVQPSDGPGSPGSGW